MENTPPEVVSIDEAAALLRVHRNTIRRYIARGHLASYRIGRGAVRIRRADLLSLVEVTR